MYEFIFRMTSFAIMPSQDKHRNWVQRKMDCIMTFLEENRQNIFYLFIFYVVTIVLFVERFIRELVSIVSVYFSSMNYLVCYIIFFIIFRLFFYGRTYRSKAHHGGRHRHYQGVSCFLVFLLQSSAAHNV